MGIICSVSVLYNPDNNCVDNIATYSSTVELSVIVDNSVRLNKSVHDRLYSSFENIHIIKNQRNLGIARALNQGIRYGASKGYMYALLMDQDSSILPVSVEQLKHVIDHNDDVFIACAKSETGNFPDKHGNRGVLADKKTCISSGSLVNLKLINDVGLHDEKLFIDLVDHELCLRAREKGYRIVQVNDALMNHKLGNIEARKIFHISFYPTHHPPVRRYYKARNSLYVWKKYFFRYPGYVIPSMLRFCRMTLEILLFENNKRSKFVMIIKGFFDGIRGKFGEYQGS